MVPSIYYDFLIPLHYKNMEKAFIQFHDVSFSYTSASQLLFEKISFHLAGRWLGVVGANGTGKTTLLRLAAGLLAPDEGRVETLGHVIYCPSAADIFRYRLNCKPWPRFAWFTLPAMPLYRTVLYRYSSGRLYKSFTTPQNRAAIITKKAYPGKTNL